MKIKVCGLKYPDNIKEVAILKPDMIGFIFYKPSKRYVGEIMNESILNKIPSSVKKVGVFVNESVNQIMDIVKKYKLDIVQLHGHETPDECMALKSNVGVIKAFGIDDSFDFMTCLNYQSVVDLFLFDTKTNQYGGSGYAFNRQLLQAYILDTPFLISGGIDINEAQFLIKNPPHPKCIGIDINSKFELPDYRKNISLLKTLLNQHHELHLSH